MSAPAPDTSQFTLTIADTPNIDPETWRIFQVTAHSITTDTYNWLLSLIWFGAYFSIAAGIIGTGFMISTCCNTEKCCLCPCRDPKKPVCQGKRQRYSACLLSIFVFSMIAAVLFFIFMWLLFANTITASHSVSDLFSFQSGALFQIEVIDHSLFENQASIVDLRNSIIDSTLSQPDKDTLFLGVDIVNASLEDAASQIDSVFQSLSQDLHTDTAQDWITTVANYIGGFSALLALDLVLIIPSFMIVLDTSPTHPIDPSHRKCNSAANVLGYTFIVVMLIIGTGLFSAAQGTSEACKVGPAAFVNETGLSPPLSDYLLCSADSKSSPFSQSIEDANTSLSQAIDYLTSIESFAISHNQTAIANASVASIANITDTQRDLGVLVVVTSCAAFSQITAPVYDLMCTSLTWELFALYICRLATAILYPMLYWWISVRFRIKAPKKQKVEDEDDDAEGKESGSDSDSSTLAILSKNHSVFGKGRTFAEHERILNWQPIENERMSE